MTLDGERRYHHAAQVFLVFDDENRTVLGFTTPASAGGRAEDDELWRELARIVSGNLRAADAPWFSARDIRRDGPCGISSRVGSNSLPWMNAYGSVARGFIGRVGHRRPGWFRPVTKSDSRRKVTAFTISTSPPQRPRGVAASTAAVSSAELPAGGRMGPGAMALTRMCERGELERQRLGQADDPLLGDVVGEVSRVAWPAAGRDPVAEVDDAPAAGGAHVGDGRAGAQKRGAQIDVDHRVPRRLVGRSNGRAQ